MKAFKPRLRSATERDFVGLCKLFGEVDLFHLREKPGFFRPVTGPARDHSYLDSLITGSDSTILVVDDTADQCLLGFAALVVRELPEIPVRAAQTYVEIDTIAVRKTSQRKGIGRMLVNGTKQWASQREIERIALSVFEFNTPAIKFYEAVGFTTLSRRMIFHCDQQEI